MHNGQDACKFYKVILNYIFIYLVIKIFHVSRLCAQRQECLLWGRGGFMWLRKILRWLWQRWWRRTLRKTCLFGSCGNNQHFSGNAEITESTISTVYLVSACALFVKYLRIKQDLKLLDVQLSRPGLCSPNLSLCMVLVLPTFFFSCYLILEVYIFFFCAMFWWFGK